jgi:cell division protein FtsN
MFESSHRRTGGSANRWLIVAGAGLVILAFVARMLLNIGHTKVSDLAGVLKPDTTSAQTAAPARMAPEATPVDVTPPVLKVDTTATGAAAPRPPDPAPVAAGSGYAVQIGAFGSQANAARLRDRASALGYAVAVVPQARGDASTLYLVRVQGLSSAESARQASDSLAHTLRVTSVVVPPGK